MFNIFSLKIPHILIFPLIICLLILILTILKIHGSSIGMYHQIFFGKNAYDQNLLFGTPRQIRSDEWAVQTPYTISQSLHGFSAFNTSLGTGQDISTFLDVPVKNWTNFFKIYNWPFFVFPLEYAFVFKWWLRGALLIIGSYLFLQYLYKNYFLSVTGSLIIFFSPFVQWWYSVSAVESIAYLFLILFLSMVILESKSKKTLLFSSFLLSYFAISFLLILYPPFQISLGLLGGLFLLGFILQKKQQIFKKSFKNLLFFLIPLFAVIVFSLIFYFSFKDLILITQNSDYPGKRVILGQHNISLFLNGFFNIFLLDDKRQVPYILGNQSEASSFFLFFPYLLPILIYFYLIKIYKEQKKDYLTMALVIYLFAGLAWMFIRPFNLANFLIEKGLSSQSPITYLLGLVAGLGEFLSQISLLNLVPFNRLMIGVGIANLLLVFQYLYKTTFKISHLFIILIGLIGFLVHFLIGNNYIFSGSYFVDSPWQVILISSICLVSVMLLLLKMKKTFLLFLLGFSLVSTLTVNPLYRGLSPVIANELGQDLPTDQRWAVYGALTKNYLVANNINLFNSTQIYPLLGVWQKFDLETKNKRIYNRYAHITLSESKTDNVEFKLLQEDSFELKINPCNKTLKEFSVNVFVFPKEVNYSCLKLVKKLIYPAQRLYIYQIKDSN